MILTGHSSCKPAGTGKPPVILAGVQQAGKPGTPWLVFLHGFSGDCREWQVVGER
jgi:pimeloyl-ACP methyl ester carboxylesterase